MTKNRLIGKWIFLKTEYRNESGSWVLHKYYHRARYIWEFREDNFFTYNGILECKFNGDNPLSKRYCFRADDTQLHICEYYHTSDGSIYKYEVDFFRVTTPDVSTLILNALDDVKDNGFRIVLKRFTIGSFLVEAIKSMHLHGWR